jgi:hypothetical protein
VADVVDLIHDLVLLELGAIEQSSQLLPLFPLLLQLSLQEPNFIIIFQFAIQVLYLFY